MNSLLREAKCKNCGASIRNSDTARIVAQALTGLEQPLASCITHPSVRHKRILEAAASGPLHRLLSGLPGYVCFEYMDDVQAGDKRNGILCNDLTRLTFADKSFDLVISQDVMEHVEDIETAFAEINRVLVNGGSHVFSVPLHEGRPTESRNEKRNVFHGDPLRRDGALVHVDWGSDIEDVINRFGYETKNHLLHRFHCAAELTNVDRDYREYQCTPAQEFFRYNSNVIRAVKVRDYCPRQDLLQLELASFGPEAVKAGQSFNVQADGSSAIWSQGKNITQTTILVVDGVHLQSAAQQQLGLVTAIVPAWLTSVPGELDVRLEDLVSGRRSRSLRLTVQSDAESAPSPAVLQLRKRIQELERKLHDPQRQIPPSFEGWRMTTYHALPWDDAQDWAHFRKASEDFKRYFNFGLATGIGINRNNADSLLWRHWNVAFAVRHAFWRSASTQLQTTAFVECGVGDGMSAFFMLRELAELKQRGGNRSPVDISIKLYDAWHCISEKSMGKSDDKQLAIIYKTNSIERAKANLATEGTDVEFIRGMLPEVFASHPTPTRISFLHVDLNSADATQGVLEHCLPRLATQAVILFDDYGWSHYRETKARIDLMLARQPGTLLKLPTGQAIYFSP